MFIRFLLKDFLWIRSFFLMPLFLLCFNVSSYAHRVNIFAWFDGEKVNGRAYYSNGIPARDARIDVFSKKSERLFSLKTDRNGRFSFDPKGKDTLRLVLYAGMGHRATTVISTGLKAKKVQKGSNGDIYPLKNSNKSLTKDTPCNLSLKNIDSLLQLRLAPLEKEIERLSMDSERITFKDILSGFGYIMGIMGLWLYFLSKYQPKKTK